MRMTTRTTIFALVVVFTCAPGWTQVGAEIGTSTKTTTHGLQRIGTDRGHEQFVKKLYRQLEETFGVQIQFDKKLRDRHIEEDIEGLKLEEALEVIAVAAGYFYKVLDEKSILVIEDTPQNRREYEELVIKTFPLHNADPRTIDKVLRSLIEARRLVVTEDIPAVTIRDTKSKVAIAERLIALFDQPRAEMDIVIEILGFDLNDLTKALENTQQNGSHASPIRMDHNSFEKFKTAGRALTLSEISLSLIQGETARYRDHSSLDIRFDLEISGRIHTDTSEVTLDTELQISTHSNSNMRPKSLQKIQSIMRLGQGTTYVLMGLTGTPAFLDELILVVALTPHIVRTSGFNPADLEELHVGTESRISFGPTLELIKGPEDSP